MTPEAADRRRELSKARRMVAIFWAFTVIYPVLSVILLVTRGASGLIFIGIMAWSWYAQGIRDTGPYFKLLREEREARAAARNA